MPLRPDPSVPDPSVPEPTPPERSAADPSGPADHHSTSALAPVVRIIPWVDPVVDRRGHDPRSAYVERFWLSVLGPTATWIMRRFAAGFDDHPEGYDLDVAQTARALGLSVAKGAASPFAKSVQRCVIFGLATARSDGWTVRRRLPTISQRHLLRLPEPLQREHLAWTTTTVALDELERAHTLATAMVRAGDDPGVVAPQLVAVGVSPAAAEEARQLALAPGEPAVSG